MHKCSVSNINDYFSNIIDSVEGSIYWKDIDGVYLGCNAYAAEMISFSKPENIIGKTDYDLFDKVIADSYRKHDLQVIEQQGELTIEEWAKSTDGEDIVQLSCKKPLYSRSGEIIGIIGNTINITDRREKERLKLENEVQKKLLQEQEKFRVLVDQMSHDIRSPLTSLHMLVEMCDEIEEENRIALRSAITRISDIANNLLNHYKPQSVMSAHLTGNQEPFLVSTALLEILGEKKFQYKSFNVRFEHYFDSDSCFVFTSIDVSAFKRMISNIINNAVDAVDKHHGIISVDLSTDNESIKIAIKDNGKGMPAQVVNKIMNNMSVTADKEDGHGIGLTQVRNTLFNNSGSLSIDSVVGVGTTLTLIFPTITSPGWLADKIGIRQGDTVVIVDDDPSIHGAWNARFNVYLSSVTLKHFERGQDAVDFIKALNSEAQQKIYLLTDYELLNQNINGLDIIKQTQIERSILVTSHYANKAIIAGTHQIGAKLLPKMLASEIIIEMVN